MSSSSIDFTNLRSITGGDQGLESRLFHMFLESSSACLAALRDACAAGNDHEWQEQAHAFKGLCANLGAEPLRALCREAQDDFQAKLGVKQNLLVSMYVELERVRQVLRNEQGQEQPMLRSL